ncbi:hypothetical protein LINPERPRIM_LOCUS33977 [Linum perenne]
MAKSKKPCSIESPSHVLLSIGSDSFLELPIPFVIIQRTLFRELQKRRSSTPKPATSYRRKKAEKENVPEDTKEIYGDPTFTLYHTNHIPNTAFLVLLVNGYNVCGATGLNSKNT